MTQLQTTTRRAGILGALSQGLTQPTPPRISIKAQRFTLVDGAGVQIPVQMFDPTYGLYLDVVIIGVNPNKSKIYYENEYDPTKDEPPTCFSDNGVAPSAQASVPQSPTCAACPNGVWGSDTSKMTGKGTKLCNDRKKLAVIVVNDPSQLVYQFQVPPASLKNVAVYANALGSHQMDDEERPGMKRPADPADIVTRIYFNPQKQGELLFQPMGYHVQMAPYVTALIAKADASGVIDITTGANDVPYQGAIALPNPAVMQALPPPVQQMQAPPPVQAFQQPPPAPYPSLETSIAAAHAAGQPVYTGNPPQQVPPQNGGGFSMQQAPQPQFQQPAAQGAPPAAPPPRTRRGGARAGAGRPAQNGAPVPQAQPTVAPFQQQAPQQPVQQFVPQQAPQPAQQSVPFQPQAAQPFTGQAPHAQPAPMQGVQEGIPPFLQRTAPAQQPSQGSAGGAPAFGMQNGAQPDPGLQAALQNAFGAPMQPRQR